ncbi:uncharacterized protein UV8b_03230 [Ustilaginoidea virens]|uniref:Uncharacterized protein n=1 Tax=Ustilaginoidea virens TaxID=1159556 RepID=A0A8E5HQ09_USTVR|nr:uncharacterized protein UV8b_03230 [Ustilaginoidea virens]QUC18989.1 hypothetical protein UV8b_03230 [Ustilaginoidea virens]
MRGAGLPGKQTAAFVKKRRGPMLIRLKARSQNQQIGCHDAVEIGVAFSFHLSEFLARRFETTHVTLTIATARLYK